MRSALRMPRPQPEWLLIVTTLLLFVFYYVGRMDIVGVFSPQRGWQSLTPAIWPARLHYAGAAVLLGILPVIAARLLSGLRPRDLGLGLGNWRAGLCWLGLGAPLAILAGWIASHSAPMRAVYPLDPAVTPDLAHFGPFALLQFLYYGAWEVLFRGVLLFGLRQKTGAANANVAQTALSVTAHFGRAWSEAFSALPAGLLFGWVTLRVGSIWYIAVVHWLVGVSLDWFILH